MFADITLSTETSVAVGLLGSMLTGTIYVLWSKHVALNDERYLEMKSQRDSYREIGEEAVGHLEAKNGRPKPAPLADVVPEHSSPTTQKQRDAADLQSLRARLTRMTLHHGFPTREESEPADESETP